MGLGIKIILMLSVFTFCLEGCREKSTVIIPDQDFTDVPPPGPPMPADGKGIIELSAYLVDWDDREITTFVDGQPVWMCFTFNNVSDSYLTVHLPGLVKKGMGMSIAPTAESMGRIHVLPIQDPCLDVHSNIFGLEPGRRMAVNLLLADFIETTGDGRCDIRATFVAVTAQYDGVCKLSVLLPMSRRGTLQPKGLAEVTRRLNTLYESGDLHDRCAAVEAIRAVRAAETMPLLEKALSDRAEPVRVAAMRTLSALSSPEATRVLRKAAESKDDWIRQEAKAELARRNGQGMPVN